MPSKWEELKRKIGRKIWYIHKENQRNDNDKLPIWEVGEGKQQYTSR